MVAWLCYYVLFLLLLLLFHFNSQLYAAMAKRKSEILTIKSSEETEQSMVSGLLQPRGKKGPLYHPLLELSITASGRAPLGMHSQAP